jgi:hypothetical protein
MHRTHSREVKLPDESGGRGPKQFTCSVQYKADHVRNEPTEMKVEIKTKKGIESLRVVDPLS